MAAPKIVIGLVERFDRNRNIYCGSGYNETRLRREFVDPFFEALGWDVDNERGVSPLYQDVVHEYGTEVEGSQKTADYAFRVGEKVKFFVEAKKPGTRLKDDAGPALQLRRYAYSAGLPLSILTDFEEFAVYDGRVPPKKGDAASRARVMYFTYDQYVEAWEKITAVFSREAVWSGAFDTYAEKTRGGKAEPVDKSFLKLLERWRDELARNVANRNREKDLDKYELSTAVQAILDRVIFLRVAEDRGIEGRGRLEALQRGEGVYGRLMELWFEADDVYNSGLFHFREEKGRATSRDELTPTLHVDDATLRKIIRELSDSPYEFGVVPVEILGQVYEQFLGKTIWLDGRGVHIDYKPEVRKAKGVYYTPQYIVEYIVKNTVGELLKGCKSPKDAGKLKILDPACGSGSFLLGAYQHLINWHLEWYVNDDPAKHEGKVVATPGPGPAGWRLTATAKKDILVQSIFGVDIDRQAVEVTKLSLLLKTLEGESRESVGAQTKFLRERILPDLGDNIKCGNSLIGSDYWEGGRTLMSVPPDEEERRRVNPFDWEVEFVEIMTRGGFDAVIGNPPYIRLQIMKEWIPEEFDYLKKTYVSLETGNPDIYVGFLEKGVTLVNAKGYLGYICPRKFFETSYGKNVVGLLRKGKLIDEVVDFGTEQVFDDATTYTCIIILNRRGSNEFRYSKVESLIADDERKRPPLEERFYLGVKGAGYIGVSILEEHPVYFIEGKEVELIEHIEHGKAPLTDFGFSIFVGLQTSANDFFVLKLLSEKRSIAMVRSHFSDMEFEIERGILKPWLSGKHMKRYGIDFNNEVVLFPYVKIAGNYELITLREFKQIYPKAFEYFCANRDYLKKREKAKMDHAGWFGFTYPKNLDLFEEPKLLSSDINPYNSFAFDEEGYFFKSGYGLIKPPKDPISYLYYLGLINSKLLSFWYSRQTTKIRGGYLRYFTQYIGQLPIRRIDFSDPADVARHDKMVALVEEMLALHKRLAAAKSDADKKRIQRAVAATDRKIDALVYELYGLTDEEIKIVEGAG